MNVDDLQNWIAILGLGGMASTVMALIAKAVIERKSEQYRQRLAEEKERRERRQETDRATYNQRLTILVREHLAAFVRSGEWPTDGDDLRRLLRGLRQRTYEHFLDPEVNRAWELLVATSVELATRRLEDRIGERDVAEFNRIRTEWEDACKASFGPLPATPDLPTPRHTRLDFDLTG